MDQAQKDFIKQALASEEGRKFSADYEARCTVLRGTQGFAGPQAGGVDWMNVIATIGKVAPAILALVGHFTPAGLLALIPTIVTTMFPGIDSQLATLIQGFLTYLLGKIPQPA